MAMQFEAKMKMKILTKIEMSPRVRVKLKGNVWTPNNRNPNRPHVSTLSVESFIIAHPLISCIN